MVKMYRYIILYIVITLLQFGCVKNTLVYSVKDFNTHDIDSIAILPVFDARRVVYASVDFEKEIKKIRERIVKKLDKKKFTTETIEGREALGNILPAHLPFLDAESIRRIGPSNANWVLVPVVTDLKNFMGATTKRAEIVCFLFDKRAGQLVWEGSGRDTSIKGATKNLMKDFPSNK